MTGPPKKGEEKGNESGKMLLTVVWTMSDPDVSEKAHIGVLRTPRGYTFLIVPSCCLVPTVSSLLLLTFSRSFSSAHGQGKVLPSSQ